MMTNWSTRKRILSWNLFYIGRLRRKGPQTHQLRRRLCISPSTQSSSDVFKHLHEHLRIDNLISAQQVANHFRPEERELLLQVLIKQSPDGGKSPEKEPTKKQVRQLFIFNTIPFVGFGFLDNGIMILAGEYIDQSIGAIFCISTMAAAALGNIISDVAGVGLAHYVEALVSSLGFKHPVLTSEQLESRRARITVNLARAFGLIVGCLLGMFPLLFFDDSRKQQK